MQAITAIICGIIANLLTKLLDEQFGVVVGTGPQIILLVILAYVLKPVLDRIYYFPARFFQKLRFFLSELPKQLHTMLRGERYKPDAQRTHFKLKPEIWHILTSTLPISGFAMGLLICKGYLPWTDGWLSLVTWLIALFPSFYSSSPNLSEVWSEVEYWRVRSKIEDLIEHYGCVTEEWLKQALPGVESEIRKNMIEYVRWADGKATRMDTSNPINWVIRRGGHGYEAGYIYHGLKSPKYS